MSTKDATTTQEIEAADLVDAMKAHLTPVSPAQSCTPEAHAAVVGVQRETLRGIIWIVRHMDADKQNGHSSKFKLGPLSISGVSATVVYRLSALAGVGYLIARAKGWLT